ncbi:MAG: acyloxyacyl hydrolase [Bacteroidales bacterium]|nr:acyloxyacyl hydrolase [Bacteroidales bacterium]
MDYKTYLKPEKRLLISFSCLLFTSSVIPAQTGFLDDLKITAAYHRGYVLPEYKYFLYMVEEQVQSFDLNFSRKTKGRNDWEQIYKYPEYGLSLFYSTLGNDRVFGHEIALYPFFKYHIYSRNRLAFDNQIGLGISYVTRKFDMESNYQNIAVGSYFNIHFNFKLDLEYQFYKNCHLKGGIAFDHFSNANFQEPNLGINYLTYYAGFGYFLYQREQPQIHELQPHRKDFDLEVIYSVGGKRTRAFQTFYYFTTSGTVELKWKPCRVFHVGIGADLFYDSSTEATMQALHYENYRKQYDFRSGIHVSQEIRYNRISLIIQEGIYLLLTDRIDHNIMYNRGIVRYRIKDRVLVQISMKSHLHILDYPELGLGYSFF